MSVHPDPSATTIGLPSDSELTALLEQVSPDDVLADPRRLSSVLALGLHEALEEDHELADLLAGVAADLGTPVALLNGVLPEALVLAAAHGLQGWLAEARATPLEWSPCREVVRAGQAWVVPDLAEDVSTRDSPLVTVDGLRAYAGVPLTAADGTTVGALCVVDVRPRDDFGPAHVELLQAAARAALRVLERRAAPSP